MLIIHKLYGKEYPLQITSYGRLVKRTSPAELFRPLLNGRTWKRHPEPFNKTKRGRMRRTERHFVLSQEAIDA